MKNKITLSQIGLYNPQRVDDEVAEKLFIARTKQFHYLMNRLYQEQPNSIPQHHLIIAQRGMGKTTLLKRIEIELRKQKYRYSFIPLLFPEEQYNLKNLAEFWLNTLDALADTLEIEKQKDKVALIDSKVKEFMQLKDKEQTGKQAYQFLCELAQSLHRRPVLLIDNMNLIFDRLTSSEQHTLRAWITQNNAPVIVGASTNLDHSTMDYTAPFYDAFQIHYLEKLTFEELIALLTNLANYTQNENLIPQIQNEVGRLKTLHQLTGGNPRTAVMLFRLIVKGFSKEINDDLEALLDEATPLYKARFEELSTQMQVIVDAIALAWDPIPLEQLREATHYENNQLSPQLKRLTEMGWIEKTAAYEAKGNAYQISERFFNIWFLMRRSSRRQKREIYCLSKFLECFYGEEIQSIARKQLNFTPKCPDHITYSLALAEAVKDEKLQMLLKGKSYKEIRNFARKEPGLLEQFDVPSQTSREEYYCALGEIIREYKTGNITTCKKLLQSLPEPKLENQATNAHLYAFIGNMWFWLDHPQKAKKAMLKALELQNDKAEYWKNLADLYYLKINNYTEAEKAYQKALESDPCYIGAWLGFGNLYQDFNNYEEAEKAFRKVVQLDKNHADGWAFLGAAYFNKLNYKKAEKAYLKAIQLKDCSDYRVYLGYLYREEANYPKAIEAFEKALLLNPENPEAKFCLSSLYRDKLHKSTEAEALFDSIPSMEKNDNYWLNKTLFELYRHNESTAKAYFKQALEPSEYLLYRFDYEWSYFSAIVVQLNYGQWLISILKEKDLDILFAPYYNTIKALTSKNPEAYIKSKAVELQKPINEFIKIIQKHR